MIKSNAYMHFENKKLKKTDKLNTYFKKMILIEYKNHLIYHLYNKKSNLIFVSCSIDVNESSMLKKITAAEIYEIESSTTEFTDSFIKFSDESINKSIFKHMTSSVRNKYKNENKMFSSFSQTKVLKIRHRRFFTKKKNIMNLA